MAERFPALWIEKDGAAIRQIAAGDLMAGEVLVRVSHSTVNYKDGLAVTGAAPVVRSFPMVGGIDLAGVVAQSGDPALKPGDGVLVNGHGLSETHFGGYAGFARVNSDWCIPIPAPFSPADAMAIGTAGYTAMLAVLALADHGITPAHGPALVTGAAGGVGSVAVALLARRGFHVIAATGRVQEEAYLKGLGAAEILPRAELQGAPKPIAKERWSAAVDSVGSVPLANVLSMTRYGGAVAACGLAAGMDLPASVAPFILRGVALFGIESVHMHRARRLQAWAALAAELDPKLLAGMTRHIALDAVPEAAKDILAGKVRGRLVVDIAG